jgi:hypothetical protein
MPQAVSTKKQSGFHKVPMWLLKFALSKMQMRNKGIVRPHSAVYTPGLLNMAVVAAVLCDSKGNIILAA